MAETAVDSSMTAFPASHSVARGRGAAATTFQMMSKAVMLLRVVLAFITLHTSTALDMQWTPSKDGSLPNSERYRGQLRRLCDLLDKGQLPPSQPKREIAAQCKRLREAICNLSCTGCLTPHGSQVERGAFGGFSAPSIPKEVRSRVLGGCWRQRMLQNGGGHCHGCHCCR
jgi:hypothetical protein